MEMAELKIEPFGPGFVEHNMPCAVCSVRHAVYWTNAGVFEPCWACQEKGFALVEVKNKFLQKLLKHFRVKP